MTLGMGTAMTRTGMTTSRTHDANHYTDLQLLASPTSISLAWDSASCDVEGDIIAIILIYYQ